MAGRRRAQRPGAAAGDRREAKRGGYERRLEARSLQSGHRVARALNGFGGAGARQWPLLQKGRTQRDAPVPAGCHRSAGQRSLSGVRVAEGVRAAGERAGARVDPFPVFAARCATAARYG
jgi:hypothetical protein